MIDDIERARVAMRAALHRGERELVSRFVLDRLRRAIAEIEGLRVLLTLQGGTSHELE